MKKVTFTKGKNKRKMIRTVFNIVQAVSLAVFVVMGTVLLVGIGQYGLGQNSIKSEIKNRVSNMTNIAGRYASLVENKKELKEMNYSSKLRELSRLKKEYFSDKNSNFMFFYDGYLKSVEYNTTKKEISDYSVKTTNEIKRYVENYNGDFKFIFDGKKIYNDAIKQTYERGVESGEYDLNNKKIIIKKLKKLYPYDRTKINFSCENGNLLCYITYDQDYAQNVYDHEKNDKVDVPGVWQGADFCTYNGEYGYDTFTGEFRNAILDGCNDRSVNAYDIANGDLKLGACRAYEKNGTYYVKATQYEIKASSYDIIGKISSQLKTGDCFYYLLWYKDHERFVSFMTYFSGILLIISSICIAIFAKTAQNEKGSVKRFYRLPVDIMAIVLIAVAAVSLNLVVNSGMDIEKIKSILKYGITNIMTAGVIAGSIVGIFVTLFYTSLCAQIKDSILIDNMFITKVILSFAKTIKSVLSMVKLSVIIFGFYWIAGIVECIIAVVNGSEIVFFAIIVSKILGSIIIARILRDISKIHTGIAQMSAGGVDVKINTAGMMLPVRMEAEALNNISDGMKKAVDLQMKSERMKTELITNVSHDIKTPVTAIISYVDLLKKEDIQNKTAAGYIEVLDRQSLRLKNLIYDLLDLSKSSTGNVEVDMSELDLAVFVEQSLGEFASKMDKKGLTAIVNFKMDDEEKNKLRVMADGRHLSRVFDNIFQNICKYAMENTRVYIDIEYVATNNEEAMTVSDKVSISVKNMSEMPLNLSGDELMERFVRGDESRNTEGSGLGLSIAKNLMQLQNGKLEVFVDGDLFKVVVTLCTVVCS